MSSRSRQPVITCNQGPPPPNPLVVERFQSVVSQLFQQVRPGKKERRGVTAEDCCDSQLSPQAVVSISQAVVQGLVSRQATSRHLVVVKAAV